VTSHVDARARDLVRAHCGARRARVRPTVPGVGGGGLKQAARAGPGVFETGGRSGGGALAQRAASVTIHIEVSYLTEHWLK